MSKFSSLKNTLWYALFHSFVLKIVSFLLFPSSFSSPLLFLCLLPFAFRQTHHSLESRAEQGQELSSLDLHLLAMLGLNQSAIRQTMLTLWYSRPGKPQQMSSAI